MHTAEEYEAALRLCQGLLYRRLFKTIDLTRVEDTAKIEKAVAAAATAIEKAGGESAYTLFYDNPADTPYKAGTNAAVREILICQPDGQVGTLADASPFIGSFLQQLTFRRIHVDEAYRDMVEKVVADVISGPSPSGEG